MSNHPYLSKPDYQFWKRAPGSQHLEDFDPVARTDFTIAQQDRVVTAGSCFAQHVARHLSGGGLRHFVTERAHPIFPDALAAAHNYGAFSARYGNVYTTRQLRQLLERAYGHFDPIANAWKRSDGRFADPFRPQIQPGGFISERELALDQRQHFGCVRQAIERLSVFVFTLGLTEAWADKRDGAVFPIAPGVSSDGISIGAYDDGIHEFINLTVDETVADLSWSLDFIRAKNPGARFILTVSPVPLNATAIDQHVAVATSYSKAVLRVAAETVSSRIELCDYFPSYEIITSPMARGAFFAEDCRSVTEKGVEHVMSTFFRHYAATKPVGQVPQDDADVTAQKVRQQSSEIAEVVQVLCDEELLSNR